MPRGGEASSAFSIRLSSTWRSPSCDARTVPPSLRLADEPNTEVVGPRLPCSDALLAQLAKVDLAGGRGACVRTREHEQGLDEPREALDLGERALEVRASRFREIALEVLEAQPQRRQRRPQLVRRVGDELVLRAKQQLEPARRSR